MQVPQAPKLWPRRTVPSASTSSASLLLEGDSVLKSAGLNGIAEAVQ
jgi:hypothetical protein